MGELRTKNQKVEFVLCKALENTDIFVYLFLAAINSISLRKKMLQMRTPLWQRWRDNSRTNGLIISSRDGFESRHRWLISFYILYIAIGNRTMCQKCRNKHRARGSGSAGRNRRLRKGAEYLPRLRILSVLPARFCSCLTELWVNILCSNWWPGPTGAKASDQIRPACANYPTW